MNEIKISKNRLRENSVKSNYLSSLNDNQFKKLVDKLNINEKEVMYNTSKLQNTIKELNNCQDCPGLAACKNSELGCVNYPQNYNDHLIFSYVACKYKKEYLKKELAKNTEDKVLLKAQMKDIDIQDKSRVKLIKWITSFIKNYDPTKNNKGLYLHGNFGSGKTFILSAMFNELKNSKYSTEIVYFPELLRELKGNFDTLNDNVNYLNSVDLLLIDDIGAEKVSDWSRDEILGTILQSRMNEEKATFFTSNFNIEELEQHLSLNGLEPIKARRIIERIKQLTEDLELKSENRRK